MENVHFDVTILLKLIQQLYTIPVKILLASLKKLTNWFQNSNENIRDPDSYINKENKQSWKTHTFFISKQKKKKIYIS